MIRALVVDNLRIQRESLSHILSERVEITVVGTAAHPASALAMVQDLDPNVVIVSMRMPQGPELAARITELCGKTQVVALGDCTDAAIPALPDPSLDDLIAAVHAAAHSAYSQLRHIPTPVDPSIQDSVLTPREHQIVRLIDEGLSNKEIARELNVAVSTVKNHVHSILEKLHVPRRGQAAAVVRANSTRSPGPQLARTVNLDRMA